MTISNNQNVIDLGGKAALAWNDSIRKGDGGDALATVALYLAVRFMDFTCTYKVGKADPITDDFDLIKYMDKPKNENGTANNTLNKARKVAILTRIFGIKEVTNAIDRRLNTCVVNALYLAKRHEAMSDDQYIKAVTIDKGKLTVPYGAVHPMPKADDENKVKTFEKMKDEAVVLNGKEGASLAELNKRAKPATTAPRGTKDKAGQTVSFLEIVKAARAGMAQLIKASPDEGTDAAPTTPLRLELAALQLEIVTFINKEKADDKADDISEKINKSKAAGK